MLSPSANGQDSCLVLNLIYSPVQREETGSLGYPYLGKTAPMPSPEIMSLSKQGKGESWGGKPTPFHQVH